MVINQLVLFQEEEILSYEQVYQVYENQAISQRRMYCLKFKEKMPSSSLIRHYIRSIIAAVPQSSLMMYPRFG